MGEPGMEQAQAWLVTLAEWTVLVADMVAVLIVLAGTILTVAEALRWRLSADYARRTTARAIWIRYARWLVAALTFQLGADIVETTIAPSYEDIGRLAAIAVIRTFLNYFLERDLKDMREAEGETVHARA